MPESSGSQRKRCRDCGKVKPATEFWRRKQSPDGLALYCRECFGLRNAASYRGGLAVAGKKARPYRRYSAVPAGTQYCANCGQTKPLSEFGRNSAKKSGRANYCKPCHNKVMAENKQKNHGSTRSYHLKRRYGLTADDVAEIQRRQLGNCLICMKSANLHVDHDHASGDFRGLLCFNCNNGLGQFRDDPTVLRRAANYLDGAALIARSITVRVIGVDDPQPRERSMGEALRRHYRLTSRYGIGLDELHRMLVEQRGLCPICRHDAPRDVDHDHQTGVVRGILCPACNSGMGQFRDDPMALRRAADYLDGVLVRPYLDSSGFLTFTVGNEIPEPQVSALEGILASMIAEAGAG